MPRGYRADGTPTGGSRGGGRPSKVEEDKLRRLALSAIAKEYGSETKFWEDLAKKSKNSFPHRKLLMEYTYGKPKERIELDIPQDSIPLVDWGLPEKENRGKK